MTHVNMQSREKYSCRIMTSTPFNGYKVEGWFKLQHLRHEAAAPVEHHH